MGHGTKDDISTPKPLEFFKSDWIIDFCCGDYHMIAITEGGKVFSWGEGLYGQLGNKKWDDCY